MEFDLATTSTKSTIVKYFEMGLKPSIKAKMDQDIIQLIDYKELVANVVKTEAKTSLRPSFYLQEIDQYYLWENRPAHNTIYKVKN